MSTIITGTSTAVMILSLDDEPAMIEEQTSQLASFAESSIKLRAICMA